MIRIPGSVEQCNGPVVGRLDDWMQSIGFFGEFGKAALLEVTPSGWIMSEPVAQGIAWGRTLGPPVRPPSHYHIGMIMAAFSRKPALFNYSSPLCHFVISFFKKDLFMPGRIVHVLL